MAMAEDEDASSIDRLPDDLILLIFNSVAEVKTLIRCRAVSKRFNSLVRHTYSLSLKVDCVISSDDNSFLLAFFKSVVKSFFHLISPILVRNKSLNSPAQVLRHFHRIQRLEVEFPSGDLKLEKVGGVKWKAEFGDALRSCVILNFRAIRNSDQVMADEFSGDVDFIGELKTKVSWTISTLITASVRHHGLTEVVEEHGEMETLVLRDRGGDGAVVMEKKGLEELRKARRNRGGEAAEEGERRRTRTRTRTRVPSTTVRMRHQPRLLLRGGVWMEDATMVVVRPTGNASKDGAQRSGADLEKEDDDLALRAFEGVYREAVEALLKKGRRCQLKMNSF